MLRKMTREVLNGESARYDNLFMTNLTYVNNFSRLSTPALGGGGNFFQFCE
jgi:hypothetical protein